MREGVSLHYDTYGDGAPTVLLVPAWSIVHSRIWKAQVAFLARHYRVITFDGRGSGRSSRPRGAAAFTDTQYAADALAVLDATGTDRAVLVGLSCGATWAIHLAAANPERVQGIFAIAPACGLTIANPDRELERWLRTPHGPARGWQKYNRHNWLHGDLDTTSGGSTSRRCFASRTPPNRSRTRCCGRPTPMPKPWSTPPPRGWAPTGSPSNHSTTSLKRCSAPSTSSTEPRIGCVPSQSGSGWPNSPADH